MSTNILVTGGGGYLGSTMVPMLLDQGFDVTVLDSFMYGQNSLAHVCANPKFSVVRGDIRKEADTKPLLNKADIVIPLAAFVGAPLCDADPVGSTSTNKDAALWMLGELSNDQRVLMPTTNSFYGSGSKDNMCDEESPINPISRYAKDKADVEAVLMQRENAISFRLATVFGMSPRMRIDLLVNDFTHRAVYDRAVMLFESHFKRNYIHVRDVARAFLHGIENFDSMKGGIFNVGLSDANVSKMELCQRIEKQLPGFTFIEAPIGEDPDKRNYIVSNAKIEAAGYKPAHSLDAGIAELIKGFTMIRNTKYGNV